jgi:hypothetical protein
VKVKTNAARRLHAIFERAQGPSGDPRAGSVWCKAVGLKLIGLSDAQQMTLALEVVAKLRKLIDEVEQGLKQHSSSTKYVTCLTRIREYINGGTIQAPWSGVVGQIYVGETLALLEMMADVLPDEGDVVAEEEIINLLQEIDALSQAFEKSSLPSFHAYYARILLTCLKQALIDYAFFGIRGIRQSMQQTQGAFSEMSANQAVLATEADAMTKEQNALFTRLCVTGNSVAEYSKKAYYVMNVALSAYKGIDKFVLPWLK